MSWGRTYSFAPDPRPPIRARKCAQLRRLDVGQLQRQRFGDLALMQQDACQHAAGDVAAPTDLLPQQRHQRVALARLPKRAGGQTDELLA